MMQKITKAVLSVAATVALAGTFVVGPVAVAQPGSATGPSVAQAGTWVPQVPPRPQPIGWGDRCLVVKKYVNGRYDRTVVYHWFTTSLTGSVCQVKYSYR
ncbi:hypothetical protein [Kocuria rosea]|uniref:hypothetical protein n=1 Tax=Kocuria rosea TaxID=1275 RepID=UPI003D33C770